MKFLVISTESKVTKNGKSYGVVRLYASDTAFDRVRSIKPTLPQEFDLYCWAWDPTSGVQIPVGSLLNITPTNIEISEGSFCSTKQAITDINVSLVDKEVLRSLGYEQRLKLLIPDIVEKGEWNKVLVAVENWVSSELQNNESTDKAIWFRSLLEYVKQKFEGLYGIYSEAYGAKRNHHAYKGGLLNHTFQMLDMLVRIHPAYNKVTRCNLLYSVIGVLFHDYGKLVEYDSQGNYILSNLCMLGHPYISATSLEQELMEVFESLKLNNPKDIREELTKIVHIVLSHHAVAEHKDWGSPVTPHSAEALLVSNLDFLSGYGDKFNVPSENNFYSI